jgi:hypothetical protein
MFIAHERPQNAFRELHAQRVQLSEGQLFSNRMAINIRLLRSKRASFEHCVHASDTHPLPRGGTDLIGPCLVKMREVTVYRSAAGIRPKSEMPSPFLPSGNRR